jgi:hypothetical protein
MTKSSFLLSATGALPLALASCGTYYKSPSNDRTTHAVIENNTVFSGVTRHESYDVNAVDGKPINYEYSWVAPKTFFLTPGPHRIEVEASQAGYSLPGFYRNQLQLTFDAKAGRTYQPKGYIEGKKSFVVWIEDTGTGKTVSGKVSQPLRSAYQGPPAPMLPPPVLLQ